MATTKQEMAVFQYTPEEDEVFNQVASRYMDFKQNSENVTDATPSPAEAFEKFAGKVFTPNSAAPSTTPAAFSTSERVTETPLQRFTRLQAEMERFQKDLAGLDKTGDQDIAALLSKELAGLQKDMVDTAADPKLAPFLQANYPLNSQTVTAKNVGSALTQQMKEYKQQQDEIKSKVDADAKEENRSGLTYDLYLSNYPNNSLSNLPGLDSRLSKLEKIIGIDVAELPTTFPDIVSGITFLQKSLSAVKDPNKLDPILRRMKTLAGELETLQEQKKVLQGAKVTEYEEKVRNLYEVLPAWDTAAHQLPLILARLQTLKEMSDVGSSAGASLSTLEQDGNKVDASLKEAQAALDQVSDSLKSSIQEMQGHVDTLEKKFDAVAAKH
mmetsp:Transcript_45573/g.89679  ORF Transcript_45573/g.89679 Transcript_45573/m.89679 type:complete len:384 (-) Transcript_45573:243-1394(-)|eukprot:CAMPEP_0175150632 /NCGR_PEP_ID=MMETSP0087-20121206/18000_1 /TAXON_ID=136419 /ORGANISM="Unknown Unknown, Strain D1" /LENGTH=383 /DNA_ID=CAMNT_0016436643 /DNA_START=28 /DNA_END=1179 /DNA_ORIENTATION=+